MATIISFNDARFVSGNEKNSALKKLVKAPTLNGEGRVIVVLSKDSFNQLVIKNDGREQPATLPSFNNKAWDEQPDITQTFKIAQGWTTATFSKLIFAAHASEIMEPGLSLSMPTPTGYAPINDDYVYVAYQVDPIKNGDGFFRKLVKARPSNQVVFSMPTGLFELITNPPFTNLNNTITTYKERCARYGKQLNRLKPSLNLH